MRHINRHARATRRVAGWGSSVTALCAALLVVGLTSPAAPADAAPDQAPASADQTTADQPAAEGEHGDGAVLATAAGEGDEAATAQTEAEHAEAADNDAPNPDEPVLSVLTVAVSGPAGEAVAGVGFDLWQESNELAGLQPSADIDTGAGCVTGADGSCTAGADGSGAPQLAPGTYYWVQTTTPEGYRTPEADEVAGVATVAEDQAGTDLDPTEVTLPITEIADETPANDAPDGGADTSDETGSAAGTYRPEGASGTGGAEGDETPTGHAGSDESSVRGSQRSGTSGLVKPMSVPSPSTSQGTAVINVNVGGIRTGTSSSAVSGLAGVTLRLYDGDSNGPSTAVDEDWAECVSDAAGDCSFIVPDTEPGTDGYWTDCYLFWCGTWVEGTPGGDNNDRRFWVVQESAADGWYDNGALVTGQTSHSSNSYQFRTGSGLRAGQTYESGTDFMVSDGYRSSSGTWQNSLENPQLPQTCQDGLDVALVLDLSGSMNSYLGNLKTSAKSFVNALAGTNSSVALFTFAQNAPRTNGSGGQNYPLMAIDAGNNQQTINNRIDAYSSGGGTNWDSGLYQVAQSSTDFDLAVVVTDGNATYYRNGSSVGGNGNTTRFIETEYAIFAANAIKAENTRVLAVGVGEGISGSAANLSAISGPSAYGPGTAASDADYFQSSWEQLASLLGEIAKGATCQATVDVTKYTQTYGSTTWEPTQGWAFDAAQRTSGGGFSTIGAGTTGATGTVEFTIQFDRMAATTTLRLTENPSPAQQSLGWELVADLVRCTVNGTEVDATVDTSGLSLTVEDIGVNDHVSCDFYNRQVLSPGIEVIKQAWTSASHDQEITSGSPVTSGSTAYWTYRVTNTGETPLNGVVVTDDQVGAVTCPSTTLAVGAQMTCTASGPVTALP